MADRYRKMTPEDRMIIVGWGAHVCQDCAVVVLDLGVHDAFHARMGDLLPPARQVIPPKRCGTLLAYGETSYSYCVLEKDHEGPHDLGLQE